MNGADQSWGRILPYTSQGEENVWEGHVTQSCRNVNTSLTGAGLVRRREKKVTPPAFLRERERRRPVRKRERERDS